MNKNLELHGKFLHCEPGGVRLEWIDLTLEEQDELRANLTRADLTDANLTDANLYGANLTRADLTRANIDFSGWPLWCGSTKVYTDARQSRQLCYHALKASEKELRAASLWDKLPAEFVAWVNEFHRVDECGRLG